MNQPPGQSGSIVMGPACSRCGGRVKTADDVIIRTVSMTSGGYVYLDVCLPCLLEWKKAQFVKMLEPEISAMVAKMLSRERGPPA